MKQHYKRLCDCKTEDKVKLAVLRQSSKELLTFLDDRGLSLGVAMKIENIEIYDGTVVILYNDKGESLSQKVSEKLMVEVESL